MHISVSLLPALLVFSYVAQKVQKPELNALPQLQRIKKAYLPLKDFATFDAAHPILDYGYMSWRGGDTYNPDKNILRITGGQGFYGGSPANQIDVSFMSSKDVQAYEVTFYVRIPPSKFGPTIIFRIAGLGSKRDEPLAPGNRRVSIVLENHGESMIGASFGTHDPQPVWTLNAVTIRKVARLGGLKVGGGLTP